MMGKLREWQGGTADRGDHPLMTNPCTLLVGAQNVDLAFLGLASRHHGGAQLTKKTESTKEN